MPNQKPLNFFPMGYEQALIQQRSKKTLLEKVGGGALGGLSALAWLASRPFHAVTECLTGHF